MLTSRIIIITILIITIQTDSTFRANALRRELVPTLISDEGPLLETSNLFVSFRQWVELLLLVDVVIRYLHWPRIEVIMFCYVSVTILLIA